jgi:hypothetical protein
MWWVILAGLALLLAAVLSPRVEFGTLVLSRSDPNAQILLATTGVLAFLLLVAALLAMRGHRAALMTCKIWGLLFSVVMISLLFALFGVRDVTPIVVMAAFSAAWYWGVSRATAAGA